MFGFSRSILKKLEVLITGLLLCSSIVSHAQFASSSDPALLNKTSGVNFASGQNTVSWMDSTFQGGYPSGQPANCPGNSKWGMNYGSSILSCLFPDQRCDSDTNPATVNWRQYHLRTQYEPQGCCVKEWRVAYYSCNCTFDPGFGGGGSYSCDTCSYDYWVPSYQGCNITKQFYSDCTGTTRQNWSKVAFKTRFSKEPTTCVGRNSSGQPTQYTGTTCYDEVSRDNFQIPPTVTSTTNSTGGATGSATFSCLGNNQWGEYPAPTSNQCPLGSYNWSQGSFVSRSGPWDC